MYKFPLGNVGNTYIFGQINQYLEGTGFRFENLTFYGTDGELNYNDPSNGSYIIDDYLEQPYCANIGSRIDDLNKLINEIMNQRGYTQSRFYMLMLRAFQSLRRAYVTYLDHVCPIIS